MALIKNTVKFYVIGHTRYKYNGREGFYLQCVEDYPVSDDSFGSSVQSAATPYSESDKLKGVPMGLFNPAIVEFVPATVNRGGNTVLIAEEVISITPYSVWNKTQSAPVLSKDK